MAHRTTKWRRHNAAEHCHNSWINNVLFSITNNNVRNVDFLISIQHLHKASDTPPCSGQVASGGVAGLTIRQLEQCNKNCGVRMIFLQTPEIAIWFKTTILTEIKHSYHSAVGRDRCGDQVSLHVRVSSLWSGAIRTKYHGNTRDQEKFIEGTTR